MYLGFMKNNKLYSILLLIICIFISLSFSIILGKPAVEGMTTAKVQPIIGEIIQDPGASDTTARLNAIKNVVSLMDTLSDQNKYTSILNDTNLSDKQKLGEITDLTNSLLKTNTDPGQLLDA